MEWYEMQIYDNCFRLLILWRWCLLSLFEKNVLELFYKNVPSFFLVYESICRTYRDAGTLPHRPADRKCIMSGAIRKGGLLGPHPALNLLVFSSHTNACLFPPPLTACSWMTPVPLRLSRVPHLCPCPPNLPRRVKCSLLEFSYSMCFFFYNIAHHITLQYVFVFNLECTPESRKFVCEVMLLLEDVQMDTFLKM